MLRLRGVRQHNLKNFDLDLPLRRLIVITGPSGSGKSSLAFDTLFAEGQRRYIETFSPYARQFFDRMDKPAVDHIEGIPPAIAIEQRNAVRTTRSTVGTMTELCDYMKVLWPHLAHLHCRGCGQPVHKDTPQSVWKRSSQNGTEEVMITFDLPLTEKLPLEEELALIAKQGYQRLLIEGQARRLEEAAGDFARSTQRPAKLTVIQDRLRASDANRARFVEACEQAFHFGKGRLAVWGCEALAPQPTTPAAPSQARLFSDRLHCAACDIEYREPSPALFSYNHPIGACPACKGFGRIISIDYSLAVPDHTKTLAEGVVRPWRSGFSAECQDDMLQFAQRRHVPLDVPFRDLSAAHQDWVLNGDPGYGTDAAQQWPQAWYGVKGYFRWLESKSYKMHVRVLLSRYRAYTPCPSCQGRRFQPEALQYKLPGTDSGLPAGDHPSHSASSDAAAKLGLTLADFYALPIRQACELIQKVSKSYQVSPGDPVGVALEEVRARLGYLVEIGVGYLTLDRPTRTLSGGETERVNLTTCLGTRLVNTLFVLDEPSVGLHPRDTDRLVHILERLRDAGNTVVVVEHEASVMRAADQLVDLGPGHGESGGQVVFQGTFQEMLQAEGTLTGAYLSGRRQIEVPPRRSIVSGDGTPWVRLSHVTKHNLKNLTVEIPLGRLVCITGVSGSGKTTLVREVLLPALERQFKAQGADFKSQIKASDRMGEEASDADSGLSGSGASGLMIEGWGHLGRVILVDQSALGKTPRSNPAVYIGAFDEIRELFAQSEVARQLGLKASAFSFNSRDGQCQRCRGAGFEKVEMQFLSDVFIRCPDCDGRRYRPHLLEVKIANAANPAIKWSIGDLLEATVDEGVSFLRSFPSFKPAARAVAKLQLLQEVGLGYLLLGQPINTLSGGESQRLKLVAHLAEAAGAEAPSGANEAKPTLFLFDEPTTGLHFDDVRVLLQLFQRLVQAGHSVGVIEHNLDVIKCADWLIDLGPEAGDEGGQIVAVGTPEQVAACAASHTGRFLKECDRPGSPRSNIALGTDATKGVRPPESALLECGGKVRGGQRRTATPLSIAKDGASNAKAVSRPLYPLATALQKPADQPPVRGEGEDGGTPNGNAIVIQGAREHNLHNLNVAIPRDQFVVVTGVSGSGKSTLAFDLLFAEGQRRFLDSMNTYARQFVEQMARPEVDLITGLPPTVSIEQRTTRGGGKSTVATVTEIYHFLRLLFARLGAQYCPDCQVAVEPQTRDEVARGLQQELKKRGDLLLLAPVVKGRKGFHTDVAEWAARHGYAEVRADGRFVSTAERLRLDRFHEHNVEVVTGVLEMPGRLAGSRTNRPFSRTARATAASNRQARHLIDETLDLGQGALLALDSQGKLSVHSTERSCPSCAKSFEPLDPKLFSYNSAAGWCPHCRGFGETFYMPKDVDRGERADAIEETWWDWMEGKRELCPECQGARLNPLARAVRLKIPGLPALAPQSKASRKAPFPTIMDFSSLSVETACGWFKTLKLTGRAGVIARDVLPEIRERLRFLDEVGLGYLELGRAVTTLSGGEAQRIRLAAQLGSNLSGVLYVLDEPTIGLHARDNEQLLTALVRLRARGNSLVVVEHDEATMRRADHIIDLGPGAGVNGGRLVASGTLQELMRHPDSITGQCLRQKQAFPARGERRPVPQTGAKKTGNPAAGNARASTKEGKPKPAPVQWLTLRGATIHNLKNLTVRFPLNRFVVVTGVSGSGKSTLLRECLLPALMAQLKSQGPGTKSPMLKPAPGGPVRLSGAEVLQAVYEVDQSPIGRTPRSIPATYVGFFDEIRKIFAQTPEARMRGYTGSRFSFNSAQGRCPECEGAGRIKLEMNFLPPAFVRCESCQGTRFNRETLDIQFHGQNICQVLDLSVDEARRLFAAFQKILRPLEALHDTGLGYLKLGQISPTLSGGEAQRVKLVTHLLTGLKDPRLTRQRPRHNLFLLEEPTIGLHASDVRRLVEVLQRLVDAGHSVLVIEHNLDLIAEADWVVDLGPEAGKAGGELVAEGTPEQIAHCRQSHTGQFLRATLK